MEDSIGGSRKTVREVKFVSEIRAISILCISSKVCSSKRCEEGPLAFQRARRKATAIML